MVNSLYLVHEHDLREHVPVFLANKSLEVLKSKGVVSPKKLPPLYRNGQSGQILASRVGRCGGVVSCVHTCARTCRRAQSLTSLVLLLWSLIVVEVVVVVVVVVVVALVCFLVESLAHQATWHLTQLTPNQGVCMYIYIYIYTHTT